MADLCACVHLTTAIVARLVCMWDIYIQYMCVVLFFSLHIPPHKQRHILVDINAVTKD